MSTIIHLRAFIGEKTTTKLFDYARVKGCIYTHADIANTNTGYFTDNGLYVKIEDIMTPLFDRLIDDFLVR